MHPSTGSTPLRLLLLALATAAALVACQEDRADTAAPGERPGLDPDTPMPTNPAVAAGQGGDVRPVVTASDTTPAHLVDASGQALYMLHDNADGSRCDTRCEGAWPPVTTRDVQPAPGEGIQNDLLGTIQRQDSTLHVTYDGQPLYRYAADAGAGRTAGHGVEDQWGEWSLVSVHGPAVPQR
ncbi:hypothetical protein QFW77_06880 [Luteimonas sp. RD2P54]|uniref:Lipoprotein with Yx(FWY)xxD motif n=1 Tax=Luteimonas endophytica TaxID=3042023 RepID=A0ABT6J954_9GAMM|nr:hypothetical protein [Luteimonas endophytica]MDH5822718.1 hypothetical protein [Luteimonas endophytica]